MEWDRPTHKEVSLACEISSYANAQLSFSRETRMAETIVDGGVDTEMGEGI